MFDTHCHLNFSRFSGREQDVIDQAKKAGVTEIVVPGTDIKTSVKALELAKKYGHVYAAVGIHPHHVYECNANRVMCNVEYILKEIEVLLLHPKVVAVGEVGLDRHVYTTTKYKNYIVDEDLMRAQKELLVGQLELAAKYKKAVILHNREAKNDMLGLLTDHRSLITDYRCVFHCCEADQDLLAFAKEHHIFIGVDGDVTYDLKKQEFVKTVPLELLVLETDSPYLLPEPLRSQKKFPNEPKYIPLIAQFISEITNTSIKRLIEVTTENAKRLFHLY